MRRLLFLLGLLAFAPSAHAQINSPVPSNASIRFDGLDWAWGGPCPYSGGCFATGDLSYQGTQGWSLPTAAELLSIPADFAVDFVFAGANVPQGGTDPVSGASFEDGVPPGAAACATPYFSGLATWCDWGDGVAGDWAGVPGGDSFAEQLYVRSASPVPEPATLGLLGAGWLAFGALGRRQKSS